MAYQHADHVYIEYSEDGTTFTRCARVKDVPAIEPSRESTNITNKDSIDDYEESIPGRFKKTNEKTIDYVRDRTLAEQNLFRDLFESGATVWFRYVFDTETCTEKGFLTSYKEEAPTGEAVTGSFTYMPSGKPVWAPIVPQT